MSEQGEMLQKLKRAMLAMGDEWLLIEEIDLEQDTFEVLHNSLDAFGIIVPNTGSYSSQNRQMEQYVAIEYQSCRTEFCSLEGLRSRLESTDHAECEYMVDGNKMWRRDKFRVIEWRDGTPVKVIWLHENINETKEYEWEQQQAVNQSYSQSKQAYQFKNMYLKRIGQEIQDPINVIVGNAVLAKTFSSKPEQVMENVGNILDSAKAAYRMVKQLEIMDVIQEGSIQMDSKAFSIWQLIRNTQDMVQASLHVRHQSLRIDAAQLYHEYVLGDAQKLQQILLNLLKNGCSYTQYLGEIYFGVREIPDDDAHGIYEFYVQDNGVGMSSRFQKIMFEPFAREYSDRIENTEGAGLGLVIVQNLVHMMGGEIRVETTYTKGTKISIQLRLRYGEAPVAVIGEDEVLDWTGWAQSPWPDVHFPGEHVLLVEENDKAASAGKELLSHGGLIVDRALNGEDAIQIFQRSPENYYRLILIDMNLPYISGYEAIMGIRHLRRRDAAGIPVIAITSNLMASEITENPYGIKAQFIKPVSVCDLMEAVQKNI